MSGLQQIGLIGSLASIILGVIAIWLSLYFYRRANELFAMIFKSLSEITASTRTTEATTAQVTSRVVDAMVEQMGSRLDQAKDLSTLRVSETLGKLLHSARKEEVLTAQREVKKELSETFSTLKSAVAPAVPGYDWGPFVRRLDALEHANKFLAVKWLHQTIFAGDPGAQDALQIAMKQKILLTYQLPNPRNEQFPTLCCKLDRSHPVVLKGLGSGQGG